MTDKTLKTDLREVEEEMGPFSWGFTSADVTI